jgi:hypothetical protein
VALVCSVELAFASAPRAFTIPLRRTMDTYTILLVKMRNVPIITVQFILHLKLHALSVKKSQQRQTRRLAIYRPNMKAAAKTTATTSLRGKPMAMFIIGFSKSDGVEWFLEGRKYQPNMHS